MLDLVKLKKEYINLLEAEIKMPEEFYDWLNECLVQWEREEALNEGLKYFFSFPEDDEE